MKKQNAKKGLKNSSGMKYKVGGHYFMKKNLGGLKKEDEVVVKRVSKQGKKTYVDVVDINNKSYRALSVIYLRKRRH